MREEEHGGGGGAGGTSEQIEKWGKCVCVMTATGIVVTFFVENITSLWCTSGESRQEAA